MGIRLSHRFPVRRTGTITRANIAAARKADPGLDKPEKVADALCGVGAGGRSHAKARHVWRARLLMDGPRQARTAAGEGG